jgi:hypothetical protein
MAITPTAPSTAQTQQGPAAATGAEGNTPQASTTASSETASSTTTTSKPDNNTVKVSISDTAAKLLAANKKVNPDGTVGPHHKPRHPNAAPKPV